MFSGAASGWKSFDNEPHSCAKNFCSPADYTDSGDHPDYDCGGFFGSLRTISQTLDASPDDFNAGENSNRIVCRWF
jgi:hypothetical protein